MTFSIKCPLSGGPAVRPGQRESLIYMLMGEIQLKHSENIDKAEKSYSTALDLARSQGARTLELQAAQHLARLRHGTGRSDEARQLLSYTLAEQKLPSGEMEVKKAKALLGEF